jgi:hypothetical protein
MQVRIASGSDVGVPLRKNYSPSSVPNPSTAPTQINTSGILGANRLGSFGRHNAVFKTFERWRCDSETAATETGPVVPRGHVSSSAQNSAPGLVACSGEDRRLSDSTKALSAGQLFDVSDLTASFSGTTKLRLGSISGITPACGHLARLRLSLSQGPRVAGSESSDLRKQR